MSGRKRKSVGEPSGTNARKKHGAWKEAEPSKDFHPVEDQEELLSTVDVDPSPVLKLEYDSERGPDLAASTNAPVQLEQVPVVKQEPSDGEQPSIAMPRHSRQISQLEDDELLEVLRYLPTRQLLRCRAVCRRWRDLALHPQLWRTRKHHDSGEKAAATLQAALSLAPCLKQMTLSTDLALERFGLLTATTSCAARKLRVNVNSRQNVAIAPLALRNQAALGGLRMLTLAINNAQALKSGGIADLYKVLHSIKTLEELQIIIANKRGGEIIMANKRGDFALPLPVEAFVSVPCRLVKSSLKKLIYASATSDPHLEFILKSHAATLQEVGLGFLFDVPTSLLAGLTSLQRLDCLLLDDMPQLLQCPRLTSLHLRSRNESHNAFLAQSGAYSFLRQATQLRHVTLIARSLPLGLVKALAESGRSEVQFLELDCFHGATEPSAELLQLCPLLPGLPQLQHLVLDAVLPDDLLRAISPSTLPCLNKLSVRPPPGCPHEWIHGPAVQDLLWRNTRLHLQLWNPGLCCEQNNKCPWCKWGCHKELKKIPDFHLTIALNAQHPMCISIFES